MLQSINIGDILVRQVGYSMVIYEFFEVVHTTKTQMILMPLVKDSLIDDINDSFHPIVRPTFREDINAKHIRCRKTAYEYSKYDPNHTYREDHLD